MREIHGIEIVEEEVKVIKTVLKKVNLKAEVNIGLTSTDSPMKTGLSKATVKAVVNPSVNPLEKFTTWTVLAKMKSEENWEELHVFHSEWEVTQWWGRTALSSEKHDINVVKKTK